MEQCRFSIAVILADRRAYPGRELLSEIRKSWIELKLQDEIPVGRTSDIVVDDNNNYEGFALRLLSLTSRYPEVIFRLSLSFIGSSNFYSYSLRGFEKLSFECYKFSTYADGITSSLRSMEIYQSGLDISIFLSSHDPQTRMVERRMTCGKHFLSIPVSMSQICQCETNSQVYIRRCPRCQPLLNIEICRICKE